LRETRDGDTGWPAVNAEPPGPFAPECEVQLLMRSVECVLQALASDVIRPASDADDLPRPLGLQQALVACNCREIPIRKHPTTEVDGVGSLQPALLLLAGVDSGALRQRGIRAAESA